MCEDIIIIDYCSYNYREPSIIIWGWNCAVTLKLFNYALITS